VIRAGTSGFSYPEWKGFFYPRDLAPTRMLVHYAERLPAVEINGTFYRRPTDVQLDTWLGQVPSTFQFAFKASRYFSAGPGFRNPREPLADFFAFLSKATTKLGPVLIQLPQHIKKDTGLLQAFVAAIPPGKRVALDLVDASWRTDDVRDVLRSADVALCVTESDGTPLDHVTTASFGYFRLRKAHYGPRALDVWAERLASLGDAYVFFKHDSAGPKRAIALMKRATSGSSASPHPR
jgi:uncharacterized protein YecE (DUF72 family)